MRNPDDNYLLTTSYNNDGPVFYIDGAPHIVYSTYDDNVTLDGLAGRDEHGMARNADRVLGELHDDE